jgi:hypothetical protein
MPNGRSGGFLLDKAELKRLIATTAQTAVVGHVLGGSPRPTQSSGAELTALVEQCQLEHVAIEEQDGEDYIIRLSNDPILWIVVGSESPMLAALHECHSRWKTKHPDWKGWIAF